MNKRNFFIYRFFTIASLIGGLTLNLANTSKPIILMTYYTMQSNLLCLIALIILPIIKKKYEHLYFACKGAVTIAILLTAIVYFVALLPNDFLMYTVSSNETGKAIGNLLVHIVSPGMVFLDYVI